MSKEKIKKPSVLAFEKKLVPSDGYFYGTTWDKRLTEKPLPLKLVEKSVRGTISNRLKPVIQNDPLKLNAEVEKPNLQKVDSCSLREDQDTLKVHFTLKILGGIENPSACNSEDFNKSYSKAVRDYIEKTKFKELAKRYATNIANGRFLWRNRVGAEKFEVIVKTDEGTSFTFQSSDFDLRSFEKQNDALQKLSDVISKALIGETSYLLLNIEAYALVGSSQEVYPSEELVLDKGKGDKSKILYSVNDVAAMHSQKIGNAIRTIDTWYPEYSTANIGPIPAEVYGSVTNLGKAYRGSAKPKVDFFTLFDRFAVGEKLESDEQEHYVMAVLVRGGVFGESSKKKDDVEDGGVE